MQEIKENIDVILAYCSTCRQTLHLSIEANLTESKLKGGLSKHTYIHEGPNEEPAHALVMILDQNKIVRRAEIVDLCIEASQCVSDFNVSAYCQSCRVELEIPISNQEFITAINNKGFYTQSYVHGDPVHALLILVDVQKNVRRAEVTNMGIAPSITLSPKQKVLYTLLETHTMSSFSKIFEGLLLLDRRSKTAIEFASGELCPVFKIVEDMEETINNLESPPVMYSFSQGDKNYTYIFSEKLEVAIVGINFKKTYFMWLQRLADVLAKEDETPNTLGVEIFLKLLKNEHRLPESSVLSDLLFSSLYSVRFTFKYEEIFDRLLQRLETQFSNTAHIFRPCALGQESILEAMNTEENIKHFKELVSLVSFVERRKLF
ncbi:MAG: hypothetical protein ACFFBD_03725 [Candidatus Hodarchaeota archaeon]